MFPVETAPRGLGEPIILAVVPRLRTERLAIDLASGVLDAGADRSIDRRAQNQWALLNARSRRDYCKATGGVDRQEGDLPASEQRRVARPEGLSSPAGGAERAALTTTASWWWSAPPLADLPTNAIA